GAGRAEPGPLACEQGGEHAAHDVLRRDVVGDRDADGCDVLAVAARGADEAAGGLSAEVRSLAVGVVALASVCRPGGVDDARVASGHVVVAETPALERAGREVGDDHIGPLGEAQKDLPPIRRAQIDGDAALPAVAADEVAAATVAGLYRQPPRLITKAGELDLDDIRSPLP